MYLKAKKIVDNLHSELKEIKSNLLIHYHKQMLQGNDSRSEGLTWIIKAIWSLGSNVIMSYLPQFLDDTSIQFLFKVTLNYSNLIFTRYQKWV